MIATTAVVVALFLVGAILLRLGLVGRRLDDHPICRTCRFDLVGVYEPSVDPDGVKCPECGIDLSLQHVRRGNRRRRKGAIATGAMLMVLAVGIGGAFGWGAASGFNWNTIKPTWLLQREAARGTPPTASAALTELIDRLESEDLDEAVVSELISIGLARQEDLDQPWEPLWGDFIEIAYFMNSVDPDDWSRFLRQCLPVSAIDVSTRQRLRAGDEVPYQLTVSKPRLGNRTSIMLEIGTHAAGYSALGQEAVVEISPSRARLGLAGGGSGRVTWNVGMDLPVGTHEVWVEWLISPRIGSGAAGDGQRVEWTERFTQSIEVVSRNAPLIEFVTDPELARQVRDSLSIQKMSIRSSTPGEEGPLTSSGAVQFKNPPIDMAFEVIWVVGDQEFVAGQVSMTAGEKTHSYGIWGEVGGFDADVVDVILRPSARVAMQTTEVDRIWGGEVRFEDVPVEWPEDK